MCAARRAREAIFFTSAVSHSGGGGRRPPVHVPMSTVTKPQTSGPFDPDLRSALVAMVRKRVPESEVEDIVQQALAEAIESPHAPTDSESLRRWIFGVAKNKVVDYHRRAGRESFDLPDVEGTPAPHVEADLLRWAEKNLREGEGEKLESIAASEKLPPPRVRQRVSRLRRHFKENWQREVAMLAALGVIVSAVVFFVLHKKDPEIITHEVVDPRAEPMRRLALEKCATGEWKPCVDGLDEARRLDPAGDTRPDVQQARQAAGKALSTPPDLAPLPSAVPTTAPPNPSSNLSPTPSPIDSAFTKTMRKADPPKAKPESTEFTPTPPAPAPVPTPSPDAKSQQAPSKMQAPLGKPQVKKPSATKGGSDSFGSDFGSDSLGGSSGGGTKK